MIRNCHKCGFEMTSLAGSIVSKYCMFECTNCDSKIKFKSRLRCHNCSVGQLMFKAKGELDRGSAIEVQYFYSCDVCFKLHIYDEEL